MGRTVEHVLDVMYLRRAHILVFVLTLWILMSIVTRNPAESFILIIYTSPLWLILLAIALIVTQEM